jgi:hypothetical protein
VIDRAARRFSQTMCGDRCLRFILIEGTKRKKFYFADVIPSGIDLTIFNRINETIYVIWNMSADANSSASVPGLSAGTCWSTEPSEDTSDRDLTTEYTNHGRMGPHKVWRAHDSPGNSFEYQSILSKARPTAHYGRRQ